MGNHLARHYKLKTNFQKLGEIRKFSPEKANTEKDKLDPHTRYMFENNHTATNPPSWKTHKLATKPIPKIFLKKPDVNHNKAKKRDVIAIDEEVNETPAKRVHVEGGSCKKRTGLEEKTKLAPRMRVI